MGYDEINFDKSYIIDFNKFYINKDKILKTISYCINKIKNLFITIFNLF